MHTITKIFSIALLFVSSWAQAQNDLVVGTSYPLNIQNKNTSNDGFILQNARYNSGNDVLQWETTHSTYGARGIRFHYNGGIYFYASNSATTTGVTFTPVTRFFISNGGNIGIGTTTPADRLHVSGGNVVLDNGTTPAIATGTGTTELGRFLRVINTTGLATPSGLKAGGVLVADDFNYANPAKNDLVIKGRVGIGTSISTGNTYALAVNGTVNATGLYVNDQLYVSSQWTTAGSSVFYNGPVGIGTNLGTNPNNYALAVNGKVNASSLYVTGPVGIGTPLTNNPNNYALAVNGLVGVKDLRVEKTSTTWPDYVFEKQYALPNLDTVASFIEQHKHLPDVPSAAEISEMGYTVGDMDAVLLKKVEELTLYIIQQQKEINALKDQLSRK
ncbi:hypothetical protein KK062_11055 [Fulvivirgaceae bacterium PWU5]|uniref:Peptidase S74 domain-containing protein n=1 Tax=Dawidia cretensis TaxID=2782350 RepID=A0AAP2DZ72_9BACT|nr:hypothetical protein [Dawidia cretensis]MBT1708767.1 hypothetical protein [Dawidia cretensis]